MSERVENKTYIAIDLKSFYASVECMERGLDPLTTRLVVADESRTDKTICLAVTPALKAYGVSGRARLFEARQRAREVGVDFLVAKPRMALYMEYSRRIYDIYLTYVAPEDIHIYSIDEVFMDVTHYLKTYNTTAHDLTRRMIKDVLSQTGITATAGIGTNLYLAKIAMDIDAKHVEADEDGVRISELDEMSYRRRLWTHRPLTDFWRVGRGIAKKLEANGMYTMGDVARCSIGGDGDFHNEDLLYRLFGVNAELLIDHAWGYEPCTMDEIHAYRPDSNSISSGQVLMSPYPYDKARLIVREMTDLMVLELVDKRLVTDQLVLTIGYDRENLDAPARRAAYKGEVTVDRYGRRVPKHGHGTINLGKHSSSTKEIVDAMMELFTRIADPALLVRRITVVANHVIRESDRREETKYVQLDLFTDFGAEQQRKKEEREAREKERSLQEAVIDLKKKYGKNAVLKGMNLKEGATARDRNRQIGGHKA